MFLSGHQTVKWRSFFQNQRCTRHCERRTHCLLLVGIEWVWICSLLWKKMKERMKDVILYNTKNDVSLPLISPRLIVFFTFVPSALFLSHFKRSAQAAMLLGFVVLVFAKGSKVLKKRNFRKGVISGRSAVYNANIVKWFSEAWEIRVLCCRQIYSTSM